VDFVGDKPGNSGWTPKYRRNRKEVKRHMKHITNVSKPAKAAQTAWVSLKEVLWPGESLDGDQPFWILGGINDYLTK